MSKKTLLTFVLGAAAGAAIGYLLSSDENKEKIKNAARKLKETLKEGFDKSEKIVDDLSEADGHTVPGSDQK